MATVVRSVEVGIDAVELAAYKVPTATDQESDGTLTWDSTGIVVVEVHAGGETGLGYTYCHPAAAQVIESKLASVIEQADALMPQRAWAQMQIQARQLGHAGIAAMAISAVDIALWDLKAKLHGCCLADALPRFHESVPIYASGGFTNLLRIDGLCKARNLPFSAHCAPGISAHACCAMETVIHVEYFFDHYRIESMLFDGTLDPSHGRLIPDRLRPGHGLELKGREAERYRVSTGGEA